MASDLVFYTNPMSRGRIVRWALEEIGAAYETEVLDYGTTMKAADYLAVNPMGKVPAIRHRGQVVTETAAICTYLADAYPDAGLAPPADQRAAYYRWLFFFAGAVEAAVMNRALGFEVPPDRERTVGYGTYATVLDVIEGAVAAGPYIAGDSFTAADIYCGSQIGFGMQFGSMERRPAFEDYYARISARPAHARAAALDDALVKPA
jgi:glutathione S-transferase